MTKNLLIAMIFKVGLLCFLALSVMNMYQIQQLHKVQTKILAKMEEDSAKAAAIEDQYRHYTAPVFDNKAPIDIPSKSLIDSTP